MYFCMYYFAPYQYQTGVETSKYWLSYYKFIGFSILTIVIIVPIMATSRIICRLFIDTDENQLEISYINRFRIKPTLKKVKLSETVIQISVYEPRDRFFQKTGQIFYSLHLTNPAFGHLKISSQDFKNINNISQRFQTIKDNAVVEIRKARIRRRKPSH